MKRGSTSVPAVNEMHVEMPPPHLNYPQALKPVFIKSIVEGCALYNYIDENCKEDKSGTGNVIFTVLVHKGGFPPIREELKKNQYILLPLYEVTYEGLTNTTKLHALVFEPFRTVSDYIMDRSSDFLVDSRCHPNFESILKGIIEGGLYLLDLLVTVGDFSGDIVAVQKNGIGGFLYPFLRYLPSRNNLKKEMEIAFRKMGVVLSNLCAVRTGGTLQHKGLLCLFKCMQKADTRKRCMRLRNAPLFLTDDQKVSWFIPQASSALWTSEYGNILFSKVQVIGWVKKVKLYKSHPELCALLEHDDGFESNSTWDDPSKTGDNAFAFLRYLRNGTQHFNQKKYQIALQHFNNRTFKDGNERKKAKEAIPKCSQLLTRPSLFIAFINSVYDGFIERLFEVTYDQGVVDVEMLDVKPDDN